jgi:hypothetical protein
MDRCNVSRPTATSWLNALADNGMLENVNTGRDRLFINREFLRSLSDESPTDATRPSKRTWYVLETSKEASRNLACCCDLTTSASAGRHPDRGSAHYARRHRSQRLFIANDPDSAITSEQR